MSASAPTSIIIPASPLDAKLLSASSAWTIPAANSSAAHTTTSPASHGASLAPGRSQPEQHFITKRQFELWKGSHPSESSNLRPPAASEGIDKMTLQGYRAPQHPASHVLQTIPPRAPSRSSRSNILSYTLHLATSARLSSYASPNGTRTLLHWAEADQLSPSDNFEDVNIGSEWFEAEQKTQGLWKLGATLLQSSRREGALPASVERRVVLAGLAEELLVSPSGERAITKIDEESVHPSSDVSELVALKPLTSPDTTTLYLSTSTHPTHARSPRDRSHSVAQSLIDLKFGGKPSEPTTLADSLDDKPSDPDFAAASAIPGTSVFGSPSAQTGSASTSELAATPHMDYRIVQSQSMRSRAKNIFANSPLPALTSSFCRRHRVLTCAVCTSLLIESSERASDLAQNRRRNIPGAGLRSHDPDRSEGGTKKALVSLIATFLKLSAALIGDLRTRARSGDTHDQEANESSSKGKGSEENPTVMHVGSAWYNLLTALLTQACLEGYLVDGWTGTEGIETLFGVGCGVWEGRGWSTAARAARRVPPATETKVRIVVTPEGGREGNATDKSPTDTDEEESEDEEMSEESQAEERERQAIELVEAAHALFGTRDIAQADYERGMRDRIHEFLNVPREKTLIQHLTTLSTKYPLSSFEDGMIDFFEAGLRLLGRPALASTPSSATTSVQVGAEPDPFALTQYFSATSSSQPGTPPSVSLRDEKRRRVE
ncbi:uncharacterized protein JCM15063_006135 [Sporobolomyces koalae]|uniref:uncharacterized protein n=1 Tax=Sporobolomyces koalae TaxID=500713 RepID=UPI00316E8036